ncbi:hypothetical protein DOTSEDRAFT_41522 [Dothistroma septosporum NZE10]|uniref:Uncharacterized protein n=1 Tax=Dothistroma septosporum (strain NZE10 / CBS 128990) TaxID=675120 RepID=N1PUC0_DOTSN|nr:hypothetical protein DOTSEDRAFT_41522 [Dothistroma septosporum NZE10]
MSYADVTAKGPAQPDSEKVPNAVPEIMHEDSGVHSLESLQSQNDHIQSLPSDTSYASQQEAEERREQTESEAKAHADELTKDAKQFMDAAEADAQRLGQETKSNAKQYGKQAEKKADEIAGKAKEVGSQVKKEAKADAKKAEKKAKQGADWAEKNQNNPVVVGNAVAITALGVLLGTGAYRQHKAGTLTWNVIGAWTGLVGAFAVGDYFVSQYFFKKYPPKN